MTKSQQTPEEQVANLQRRASELKMKIGKSLINDAIKEFPWVVGELVSKLESLNLVVTDSTGGKSLVKNTAADSAVPPPKSLQAIARSNRSKKQAVEQPSGGDDAAIPPEDRVPTKYWTMASLSPVIVGQHILSKCEPASMSVANLKAINIKGKALYNSQEHSRMVEFLTGTPGDFGLVGPYRSLSAVTALMQDKNQARGRRGKEVTLPYDFLKPGNGLYSLLKVIEGVLARHNFVGTEHTFGLKELPPHKRFEDLYVSENWSELRACISSRSDPKKEHDILLMPFFPKQEVRSGSLKAICDGPAPSGKDGDEDGDDLFGEAPPRSARGASFVSALASGAKRRRLGTKSQDAH